jgi:MFS family permease
VPVTVGTGSARPMYQVANSQIVAQGSRALLRRRGRGLVRRTVVLLGLTSLFTDISSEMVTTILPLYLVYAMGLSPIQFGVIDGIQQGASALVRIGRLLSIPGFPTLIAVGSVLALATMSDGFVYLGTQLPLLYVATSLVYMVLAAPIGKFADRVGRGRVLVSGYALLLVVYAALIVPPPGIGGIALVVIAFGTYYAATDGGLMALVSPLLPPELRASGLALVVTATSLARLFASIVFGATWAFLGIGTAVVVFGIALTVATAAAAVVLERSRA